MRPRASVIEVLSGAENKLDDLAFPQYGPKNVLGWEPDWVCGGLGLTQGFL